MERVNLLSHERKKNWKRKIEKKRKEKCLLIWRKGLGDLAACISAYFNAVIYITAEYLLKIVLGNQGNYFWENWNLG